MFSKTVITRVLTTVFTTGLLVSIAPPQAQAQAQANSPITIDSDNETWTLKTTAPDPEVSAYGGRLRIHDVHIAKMVAVTYRHCNTSRYKAAFWRYYANGEVMGRFRVSCDLARDLVSTQGLGKSEPTTINLIGVGSSTIDIPTIDISGDKAYTWMQFTKNFKPIR